MKTIATLKTACLLALTLTVTSSLAVSKKDVDNAMGRDGLQKINVKGLELAYARPGASLAAYKRVKLDPVEVQFDKSWEPQRDRQPDQARPRGAREDQGERGEARRGGVRQDAAKGRHLPYCSAAPRPTSCASRSAS